MSARKGWWTVGLFGFLSFFSPAQDRPEDLARVKAENAELREEVGRLRKDVEELRNAVAELKGLLVPKPAPAPATAAPAAPAPAPPPQTVSASEKADRNAVTSKFKVDLYGYVKLDAAWNTHRVNPGNFARWVESDSVSPDDAECVITANDTRVGIDVTGPDVKGVKTTGKLEVDFYGGGTENRPLPMLRHAYLKLEWPRYDFSLTAGQTWDVISPLFPYMINYSPTWWSGNIAYRHPQVRLEKGFRLGGGTRLLLQGAVARTIGDALVPSTDTGRDSPLPTFQGRAALQFRGPGGRNVVIGVSGHRGRDEIDLDTHGNSVNVPSWSGNLDFSFPLSDKVLLKAEVYRGANLDEYFGAIGQGINLATHRAIGDTGGWVSLAMGPWRRWRFNLGGAIDDPNDDDLNAGDRTLNEVYFGNALFDVNAAVQIGLELSKWHTSYKGRSPGDSLRFQTSFIYRF